MTKKIIIHPCENQDEILNIAKNYISTEPLMKCKCNGYHGIIAIMRDNKFIGSVVESKTSIIFKGITL